MKKRKTYEISVIDKTYSKIISDETKFYTSDTALELAFELKETEYNFESAEIVLLNVDDRSLATRPVSKINNDFVYEIDDDITTHYGDWRGQLMLVENGEVHVSSPIKFRIENDLYCNKPLEITEVFSWVGLKRYADSLVDELKQAVLSVDGLEDTFNANETTRQNTFETNESERDKTFNDNETVRQTQELEREGAESKRQTVFDDNEDNRTETFNANEATRQENEDARIEAEKQREGTVSEIENRQTFVENQFDAVQQELTGKDVISAPEIIAARNGEANLKARLDKEQQEVTAKLAQTVKKGNVSVTDINKNLGKFDQTYMSEEFLQQMAGNTPLGSVVPNDSITSDKLAQGVWANKFDDVSTVYTSSTLNLFDVSSIELGGYYRASDGAFVSSDAICSSAYIPVKTGETYKMSGARHVTYYDSNYIFSHGEYTEVTEAIKKDISFIKIALTVAQSNTFMLVRGSTLPSTYVPYEPAPMSYTFGEKWTYPPKPTPREMLEGTFEKGFRTVNIFNKDDLTVGGYYRGSDGVWIDDVNMVSSGFIPFERGVAYESSSSVQVTFYDADYVYMNGYSGKKFSVNSDARQRYVVLGTNKINVDTIVVSKKDEYPSSYVPYYEYKTALNDEWDVLNSDDNTRLEMKINERESMVSSNYSEPTRLILNDFSGYNEPYHPSVVFVEGGFAGYDYWMVQTPFPVGAKPYVDRWEVPIIYKSHDGIDWITVADPLDDLTEAEIANQDYMSDPHMLYRKDTKTLEVWYRLTTRDTTQTPAQLPTRLLRKTTTDGINWSEREYMSDYKFMWEIDFYRSPSILYDTTLGKYRMWYSNGNTTSTTGMYYQESSDGFNWEAPVGIVLDIPVNNWHADVSYYKGKYHLLTYYDHDGTLMKGRLAYYTSEDGINFKFQRTLLSPLDGNSIYSKGLYRSISMLDGNGKVRVYFSGTDSDNKRAIGVMIADSIEEMNGVRKIDGNMITTSGGKTLEDLYKLIDSLSS